MTDSTAPELREEPMQTRGFNSVLVTGTDQISVARRHLGDRFLNGGRPSGSYGGWFRKVPHRDFGWTLAPVPEGSPNRRGAFPAVVFPLYGAQFDEYVADGRVTVGRPEGSA